MSSMKNSHSVDCMQSFLHTYNSKSFIYYQDYFNQVFFVYRKICCFTEMFINIPETICGVHSQTIL